MEAKIRAWKSGLWGNEKGKVLSWFWEMEKGMGCLVYVEGEHFWKRGIFGKGGSWNLERKLRRKKTRGKRERVIERKP